MGYRGAFFLCSGLKVYSLHELRGYGVKGLGSARPSAHAASECQQDGMALAGLEDISNCDTADIYGSFRTKGTLIWVP